MRERTDRTTKKKIVEFWSGKIDECLLNFDWSEAMDVCWNCGSLTSYTYRCHIVPDMLEGDDIPRNYVLLCDECHRIAPDVTYPEAMWDWIKSNRTEFGFYDTYKLSVALKEFKSRNGVDFFEKAVHIDDFAIKFKKEMGNVGYHNTFIKSSSILYVLETLITNG
jgi:hypothetical protein